MSEEKDKIIIELVNKGLDGDMDAVNSHDDRIVRAKAKAMIMKVKKGTIERPPVPKLASNAAKTGGEVDIASLSKDELIAYLVNQGLDGNMDAVNSHEDKMVRAKAKAMMMKVKKGTTERPSMPVLSAQSGSSQSAEIVDEIIETKDVNQKVGQLLKENFLDAVIDNIDSNFIQIKPEQWFDIATWLKEEESLSFDSLQCQMGMDMGEDILESRYNLHSMERDHYVEIRIAVSRSNPVVPSTEQIWRVADWFERETYDMFGIEYAGHRDLRRILLPDDWEGWPLRKDYQEQETYHGIMVPKMKEGWE